MPRVSRAEVDAAVAELEAATLARDADRVTAPLERLWSSRTQAANAIVERVAGGRSQAAGMLMEILGTLAGERGPALLRKIARSPDAPDIVRFGAQRRAGWAEYGETSRRRTFLKTLGDPEGTLIAALGEATNQGLTQPMIGQEVVRYVPAMSREQRRGLVERASRERGAQATPLLHALLQLDDRETQRLAVAALDRLGSLASAGPLERLASTTMNRELSEAARTAARVCRERGADDLVLDLAPPIARAYLSTIDGSGGRMIVFARAIAPDVFMLLNLLHVDTWGLKGVIGAVPLPMSVLDEMVENIEETTMALVQVDPAAARGALAQALEDSAATHFPIPLEFEVWEPFLHDRWPPTSDEPVVIPELDDDPYAGRSDLLLRGADLLGNPLFESWALDPFRLQLTLEALPPPRRGVLGQREYAAIVKGTLDAEQRALWRRRLRRQAWLADETDDARARDLALAVAASLDRATPADLSTQVFWQVMVQRGLVSLAAGLSPAF
ncbi:MAG TPA: hypothetical protein VMU89_18495 [Thermomicrobiaceae bacterium]|nr:hypothetical protein [Thermomicrobiaceae bacterium]